MENLYLDYASSTPIDPEILNTYETLLEKYYMNSEGIHDGGVEVHTLLEKSRKQIATFLYVKSDEIFFTSGASEANNMAIKGYCLKHSHKGKHIITTTIEHSSVYECFKQLEEHFGFEVSYIQPGRDGLIRVEDVQAAIRKDTIFISVMAVNNEIGSIQPVSEIARVVQSYPSVKFHVDAVQALGKIPFSLQGIDLLTFTSHKMYGVKGCGILYCRNNIQLLPLISGGSQEQGMRGGTINAPACIVFAKTLRLALERLDAHYIHVKELHIFLRNALQQIEGIHIISDSSTSPYIFNFACEKITSEVMMNALNARNIYVSSQTTCSLRAKKPSRTLQSLGLQDLAQNAIRVSFSHHTSIKQLERFILALKEITNEYKTK